MLVIGLSLMAQTAPTSELTQVLTAVNDWLFSQNLVNLFGLFLTGSLVGGVMRRR